MDFVIAFEEEMSREDCEKNAYSIAETLSPEYGISWDTLHECIDSKQGNDFQHEMAQDTPSDHEYVVKCSLYSFCLLFFLFCFILNNVFLQYVSKLN